MKKKTKEEPTILHSRKLKTNMVKISILYGERDETLLTDIIPLLRKNMTLDCTYLINLRKERKRLIKQFIRGLDQLIEDYEYNF